MEPEEYQLVEIDAEAVAFTSRGEGPALLLVHGFPSNRLAWRLVMDQLVDRYAMVAVDQVGFGASTRRPARPLDGDAYADRLAALLDALCLDRVHVAGLSWGGAVAQRLAIRHPGRVKRLVLVAPISAARPLRLGPANLLGPIVGKVAPPLARFVVRRYVQRASGGHLEQVDLDAVARGYVDPLRMPGSLTFMRRFLRATHRTRPADPGLIRATTLVITPDADRIVPPSVGLELAAAIPHARLQVLPDAGHALQFEAAESLAGMMDAFLSSEDAVE